MHWSPSSRRAWIEILSGFSDDFKAAVALLAEGVDRNFDIFGANDLRLDVALLAEGVDRNAIIMCNHAMCSSSPSSRRAWIEIYNITICCAHHWSPSSRRAWIEISLGGVWVVGDAVAPLAEGVDRNFAADAVA